jgi:hypothetical protein
MTKRGSEELETLGVDNSEVIIGIEDNDSDEEEGEEKIKRPSKKKISGKGLNAIIYGEKYAKLGDLVELKQTSSALTPEEIRKEKIYFLKNLLECRFHIPIGA